MPTHRELPPDDGALASHPCHERSAAPPTFWQGVGLFVGGWWRGLWLAALVILMIDLLVRDFA